MWKLKIKKGFTLLETSITVCILTILIMSALDIQCRVVKIEEFNNKTDNAINLTQLVGNNLALNSNYETIKELTREKPWIINVENLKFDVLRQKELVNLLEEVVKDEKMYLKIYVEGDSVITIRVEMIMNIQGKVETYKYETYKGHY